MHIITKTRLKEFWEKHPNAESGLTSWYKIASKSQWQHLDDVRQTFPHADLVGQLTVFNICGNNYRLITKIVFPKGRVYIRAVLTHAEYDIGREIKTMVTAEKYMQLLQQFPPRPVNSEEDLAATQAAIDKLLDKPELTPEEEDYLDVLGTLVYEYENKQEDIIPDIYGVELLKVLIAERNLKQKDLVSIFKTESIVSDVLNQKRQLTTRHIQELADFFNLPIAVFFPRKKKINN